jgi:hypothetical protein
MFRRPQTGLANFDGEMGDLFGGETHSRNRWASGQMLRDRWQSHVGAALSRPVLVVDESALDCADHPPSRTAQRIVAFPSQEAHRHHQRLY